MKAYLIFLASWHSVVPLQAALEPPLVSQPVTSWTFAASFVPVARFYALPALPNVFGTYRASKWPKMTRKQAKRMGFGTVVSPGAQSEKGILGPLFGLLRPQTSQF